MKVIKTINNLIKQGKTKNFKNINELISLIDVDKIIEVCYTNYVKEKR